MSRTRVAILLFALVASTLVQARGNSKTVRLDVTGGDLAKPISITNRNLLDLSHVYRGQFLGELVNGVDAEWPRYTVKLVFEPEIPLSPADLTNPTQGVYQIQYSLNWRTGEGYVYLPGRGEPGYRENTGKIIRDGHDGRWHRASESWASLLNPYLH